MSFFPLEIENFLKEDGLCQDFAYLNSLPTTPVKGEIRVKSSVLLSGMPFFLSVFESLGAIPEEKEFLLEQEGQNFKKGDVFPITLPLRAFLLGERVALNLLQRSSAISTFTSHYVALSQGVHILETRKTTPGLRVLEKYAVKVGGGKNHRWHQTDALMIKDNHKVFWGGLKKALEFHEKQKSPCQRLIVEIHKPQEIEILKNFSSVDHVLLDNFTPQELREIIPTIPKGIYVEISGGITLENLKDYLVPGVHGMSSGKLTQFPPPVDFSLKVV